MSEQSPEWHPDDDPLDLKFTYRQMKILPALPQTPPRPEEQMLAWQQYQRLKFEYKERSLPLDGSYTPPVPEGGYPDRPTAPPGKEGLYRTNSTPVLASDPRLSIPHGIRKPIKRGQSGLLAGKRSSQPGGWSRASSPSIDLTGGGSPMVTRPKSGSFVARPDGRRNSVVLGKGEMVKLKNLGDTFEKAKQHVAESEFDKAVLCYSDVVIETLTQLALCLIQLEDYSEAIVNCDFALHFSPSHGKALIRKAKALAKMKRDIEAKTCRTMAAANLGPNDPELWDVGKLLGIPQGERPLGVEDHSMVMVEENEGKKEHKPLPIASPKNSPRSPKAVSNVDKVESPIVSPNSTLGRGRGRGSSSGSPLSNRTSVGRGRGAESPGLGKKLPPTPGSRMSSTLKKPSGAAPTPPAKKEVKADPLDPSLNYMDMEDDQLPSLPAESPTIDEDMERWQQYQRLKTEYVDRNIEPRYQE